MVQKLYCRSLTTAYVQRLLRIYEYVPRVLYTEQHVVYASDVMCVHDSQKRLARDEARGIR